MVMNKEKVISQRNFAITAIKTDTIEKKHKIRKKTFFFSKKTQIYQKKVKFVNILYTWGGEGFLTKKGCFFNFLTA